MKMYIMHPENPWYGTKTSEQNAKTFTRFQSEAVVLWLL